MIFLKIKKKKKKSRKEEQNDQIINPGDYIVSCNIKLLIKDRGYSTKHMSELYTVEEPEEKVQLKKIVNNFITNSYHDSQMEYEVLKSKIYFTRQY